MRGFLSQGRKDSNLQPPVLEVCESECAEVRKRTVPSSQVRSGVLRFAGSSTNFGTNFGRRRAFYAAGTDQVRPEDVEDFMARALGWWIEDE